MHVAIPRIFTKKAKIEYLDSKPVKQTDEKGVGVKDVGKALNCVQKRHTQKKETKKYRKVENNRKEKFCNLVIKTKSTYFLNMLVTKGTH